MRLLPLSSNRRNTKANKWLKPLLKVVKSLAVILLIIISIYVGLWIGYVKFGGQPASDIFNIETWKLLIQFIFNK